MLVRASGTAGSYVKNGMIDWSYTGVFLYYGRLYYIQKGWHQTGGYNGASA